MDGFGKRLRELRTASGLSQEAVAARLGVSAQSVSKWENGKSLPDVTFIVPLAELFHISTDELIGKAEAKVGRRMGAGDPGGKSGRGGQDRAGGAGVFPGAASFPVEAGRGRVHGRGLQGGRGKAEDARGCGREPPCHPASVSGFRGGDPPSGRRSGAAGPVPGGRGPGEKAARPGRSSGAGSWPSGRSPSGICWRTWTWTWRNASCWNTPGMNGTGSICSPSSAIAGHRCSASSGSWTRP